MNIVILKQSLDYDGLQLSTTFVDEHAPDSRDALVAFQGVADVSIEHMVDLDDVEAGEGIYSPAMAHVIIEHRGLDLAEGVWRQRLLMRLGADWIAARAGVHVEVRGDDLYVGDGKLSVSIATRSPRSVLIHAGVNIQTEGTPVKTAGLRDLRIRATDLLRDWSRLYADEVTSVEHALGKVRSVP